MGVAVLEGKELVYHGVETIRNRRPPHQRLRECRRRVIRLVNDFRPNLLVIEKPFFANNRNVALLNVLVDEIRSLARRQRLPVLSFAPSAVKKHICGNGWASKKEVARVVVAKYPELKVYLTQDRAWKEKYHENMFDAVALGMMALGAKTVSRS